MTETITSEPAGKRGRNASVILTDRMCEKRVTSRVKIYDRKCPGLYVSINTAGVATFSFIRRGLEREAMEFAVELMHTSKAFHTMVCNRLEVICHEDLDTLAAPWVVPFVATAVAQSRERYSKSIGEARLMIGSAIRMMARAPKSRAGCHFGAAIGLRSMLEGFAPEIPDWANDQHSLKGKAMGRGLDHFRSEGARLITPPTEPDAFEDEAYRLWALKQGK